MKDIIYTTFEIGVITLSTFIYITLLDMKY